MKEWSTLLETSATDIRTLGKIPANLEPPVQGLPAYQATQQNGEGDHGVSACPTDGPPGFNKCDLGDLTSSTTMVLAGDSHALVYDHPPGLLL